MAKKDWMLTESELDDDQIAVLTATLDKSCIVEGCAGSGKSILALIKAQRIQKEKGDNYQIIVFTKALCRYMNTGRTALGLKNDFSYYWDWKNRKHCPHSDYVIVDEIQDFDKEELLDFLNSSNKHFFFFGDTAQSIYNGLPIKNKDGSYTLKVTIPVDEIASLAKAKDSRIKTFNLYRNYRLPIPVARFVQYIGVGLDEFDESTYKSQETEKPFVLQYYSFDDQVQAITDIIKNRSLTDVAILLPHNDDVKYMADKLRTKGLNIEQKSEDRQNYKNGIDSLDFNTQNPKVMTYHSAKGLQFEAVFIPDVIDTTSDSDRKALYVAMTRTYKYLFIMYSGKLPSPINTIPQNLYNTEATEKLKEII